MKNIENIENIIKTMEDIRIVENSNLLNNLKILKNNGYNFIIKFKDNFLSGWGQAENTNHYQLIACLNNFELKQVQYDLSKDNTAKNINWYTIANCRLYYYNKKSYTIRNDWVRALPWYYQEIKDIILKTGGYREKLALLCCDNVSSYNSPDNRECFEISGYYAGNYHKCVVDIKNKTIVG